MLNDYSQFKFKLLRYLKFIFVLEYTVAKMIRFFCTAKEYGNSKGFRAQVRFSQIALQNNPICFAKNNTILLLLHYHYWKL